MTEVRFYHLTTRSLEDALPTMLERTVERGKRAVVLLASEGRAEELADRLWRFPENGFLPHGTVKDGHAEAQPIWLTDKDENPNDASYLFLLDGAVSERLADYELCSVVFDGRDETAVAAARARWRRLKDAGHRLVYQKQDENGRWTAQAET